MRASVVGQLCIDSVGCIRGRSLQFRVLSLGLLQGWDLLSPRHGSFRKRQDQRLKLKTNKQLDLSGQAGTGVVSKEFVGVDVHVDQRIDHAKIRSRRKRAICRRYSLIAIVI